MTIQKVVTRPSAVNANVARPILGYQIYGSKWPGFDYPDQSMSVVEREYNNRAACRKIPASSRAGRRTRPPTATESRRAFIRYGDGERHVIDLLRDQRRRPGGDVHSTAATGRRWIRASFHPRPRAECARRHGRRAELRPLPERAHPRHRRKHPPPAPHFAGAETGKPIVVSGHSAGGH